MKFNNFNYYLNLIKENTTLNSEKETKLEAYNKKLQIYNAKKNNFKSIFSQPQERWEDEAKKIIDGNDYLSMKWKLDKMEWSLNELDDKLKNGELTSQEKTDIQNQINDNKKQFNDNKKEIDNKIRQDLNVINNL